MSRLLPQKYLLFAKDTSKTAMHNNSPNTKASVTSSCIAGTGQESILLESLSKPWSNQVNILIYSGEDVQIIALGAGLETLWYNLQ